MTCPRPSTRDAITAWPSSAASIVTPRLSTRNVSALANLQRPETACAFVSCRSAPSGGNSRVIAPSGRQSRSKAKRRRARARTVPARSTSAWPSACGAATTASPTPRSTASVSPRCSASGDEYRWRQSRAALQGKPPIVFERAPHERAKPRRFGFMKEDRQVFRAEVRRHVHGVIEIGPLAADHRGGDPQPPRPFGDRHPRPRRPLHPARPACRPMSAWPHQARCRRRAPPQSCRRGCPSRRRSRKRTVAAATHARRPRRVNRDNRHVRRQRRLERHSDKCRSRWDRVRDPSIGNDDTSIVLGAGGERSIGQRPDFHVVVRAEQIASRAADARASARRCRLPTADRASADRPRDRKPRRTDIARLDEGSAAPATR